MIDIHHHLLFGLDDGSPTLVTSVEMARIAVAEGITHVVCTPHASGNWTFDPVGIDKRLTVLRSELARQSIPLTLGAGCDFHLSYDNIQEALRIPAKFAINATQYLLVELPDFGIPASLTETFYEMQIAGITPILTHPERNPTLQKDAARLADWLRAGVLIQVTTHSVIGKMGKPAERMAHELLRDRWVHFLATDAHNTTSRAPHMRQAYDVVATKYKPEYADLLCTINPRCVFQGLPLMPQMEPLKLFEDEDEKKPFFKRLFGR